MRLQSQNSFPEKLLARLGHHYILAMMLITRLGGAVGGLIVIYYVEFTLEIPDITRWHFRVTSGIVVALTITATVIIALRETRNLRRVLRAVKTGGRSSRAMRARLRGKP